MHRNALCWCRSGLKWKACHRDRERMPAVNPRQALTERFKPVLTARCLHPDAPKNCSGYAIRSHTLQKGSALAAIAEDQHVISGGVPAAKRIMHNDGEIIPQRTGVNHASTFPGFCSHHDMSLFLPIERGDFPITREAAFLLGYRTMAYELHAKQAGLKGLAQFAAVADAGEPFEEQVRIQTDLDAMSSGMRLGEADLVRWKVDLDQIYRRKNWPRAEMLAIQFADVLPFVVAFANQPEWDFSGRRLQHPFVRHPGQASLTVTVAGGRTLALFTWFDESTAGARLAQSFEAISVNDRPTALLRHCLAFSENIHMRPSWWQGLTDAERDDALLLMKVGMPIRNTSPEKAVLGAGPLALPPVASHVLTLS